MPSRQRYRPPADLDSDAAAIWRETERALDVQGTYDPVTDREALKRYCNAVSTAKRMRTDAQAEPWVTGSAGQIAPHPGWRLAAEANRDAARYAADLLLTPTARKRAGITAGAADSDFTLAGLGLS